MKVTEMPTQVRIETIKSGEVFEYDLDHFMVIEASLSEKEALGIENGNDKIIAICLEDGTMSVYPKEFTVKKLTTSLMLG